MTHLTKKRSRRSTRKPEDGMAMVGTMLVLLGVTSMVIVGAIQGLNNAQVFNGSLSEDSHNQLSQSNQRGNRFQAEVLSETGIRLAIQWLVQQTTAPANTAAFSPGSVANFYNGTESTGWTKLTLAQGPNTNQLASIPQVPGDIYVRFYPFSTNSTGSRKMYAIESRGEYMGFIFLSRIFVRQNSFSRYAYFSDTCPTSWWVTGLTRFQGPVHVNGVNTAGTAVDSAATLSMIWTSMVAATSSRIFTYADTDYFTTAMAASQLKWYRKTSTGTSLSTPASNRWTNVTAAAVAPQTGVPLVPMPVANTNQRVAALGGATAITSIGVQIPGVGAPTAGVYINGDIKEMYLKTFDQLGGTYAPGLGDTSQQIQVIQYNATTQKDIKTVVDMIPGSNTTNVYVYQRSNTNAAWDNGGAWTYSTGTTYTGVPNGVIYVNGHIGEQTGTMRGGLSGTIANSIMVNGAVTRQWGMIIATEQTKGININGGIVYRNLISNSTNPNNILSTAAAATAQSGMMGLVAGDMRLTDTDDGGTALTNVSVHAICMAYNTFNATNPSTRAAGVFNLIGGYIVKNNGTFGSALPDGTVENGFLMNRNFDQRVTDTPPPAFPAVEKQYQILSYQRAVTSLE
jgi:hypothetical protein